MFSLLLLLGLLTPGVQPCAGHCTKPCSYTRARLSCNLPSSTAAVLKQHTTAVSLHVSRRLTQGAAEKGGCLYGMPQQATLKAVWSCCGAADSMAVLYGG